MKRLQRISIKRMLINKNQYVSLNKNMDSAIKEVDVNLIILKLSGGQYVRIIQIIDAYMVINAKIYILKK